MKLGKVKQLGRRIMCMMTAFMMMFSVGGNFIDAFAESDVSLTHDQIVKDDTNAYQEATDYLANHVNSSIISTQKGRSVKQVQRTLKETKHVIRLKRLVAQKSAIPKNCTIDDLWKKYGDAVISQYTEAIPLYDVNDSTYYIANLSASQLNGLGEVYDNTWIQGRDNANPNVIHNVKFDQQAGIAYVPRVYFDTKNPKLITGQLLHAGDRNNKKTNIDVEIVNPNKESDNKKMVIEGNTYDITTKIPITDSSTIARNLTLTKDDFEVYINGSDTPYQLTKGTSAVYDQETGELELALSPSGLTSIRIEIRKKGLAEKISDFFTTDVHAKITNPDKLLFAKDKETNDPIVLDKIDTSKLKDGQVYEYKGHYVTYFTDTDEWSKDDRHKAWKESLDHSVNYLYVPSGSSETGYFDIYDKGNDFDDANGVVKGSEDSVNFGIRLPGPDVKYQAKSSNNVTLNFHQKGDFVTKNENGKDVTYSDKRTYAGECAHITNPMGSFENGEENKVRLSILHVNIEDGYVIIGLNTEENNTQSGFGIYKLAIESTGSVQVKKTSTYTDATNNNSCYSFEGATFGVYSDSACTKKVGTLTAKANGSTNVLNGLTAGKKYYIKETKAPKGYVLSQDKKEFTADVDSDEDDPTVVSFPNTPKVDPATIQIKKVDLDTGESNPQGDAALAGTRFIYKFYAGTYNKNNLPSKPTRTWVFETKKRTGSGETVYDAGFDKDHVVASESDEFYYDADGNIGIPYGTITIEEKLPPTGYNLDNYKTTVNGQEVNGPYLMHLNEDSANNSTNIITEYTQHDSVVKFNIEMTKFNSEFDKSEASGGADHKESEEGATLAGVTFDIINRCANPITYNNKTYQVGETITKATTKWDENKKAYVAKVDDLPYGTYGIKEVSTSTGFLLDDNKERIQEFHPNKNGTTYTYENTPNLKFSNTPIRGDYTFSKKTEDNQHSVQTIFKLTNTTTKESHYIMTDRNGVYDSTENDKTVNTNAYDEVDVIKNYKDGDVIKIADVKAAMNGAFGNVGTWFSKGEDGSTSKPNNNRSAFLYGEYQLDELRTDTNEGYELIQSKFYISKNDFKVQGHDFEDKVSPNIATEATDNRSHSHLSLADKETYITDTVGCDHLKTKTNYKLVGTVMNKKTGEALTDDEGKAYTSSKTFTSANASSTIKVPFVIDTSVLKGEDIVFFETLYEVKDDGTEVEVARHHDINDEGQTISIPNIGTTALDSDTKDHVSKADEDMTIVDTVRYENLIKGEEYVVNGTFHDAETGKAILDDEGKEVTASTKFTAKEENGTVDVAFHIKGVSLAGKTMVAFETIEYQEKTIAVHSDIKDKEQTIIIPKIQTTATNKETETHTANPNETVTIVDKVSYENVPVGKELTVNGYLTSKETGEPLIINGEKVTASKTFVPEEASGSVELEFTFNGSALAGTSVVVFEDLMLNDTVIGSHHDSKDEGQTINFPEIKTSLLDDKTKSQNALAEKEITLVDTVTYTGLTPGETYDLIGVLMDPTTEKPLTINGKEVTATTPLTPKESNGTATVTFTFDGTGLENKTYVAFETLKQKDVTIAVHTDIKDEPQTIYLPKIGTTALDKASKTHTATAGKKITIIDTVAYENLIPGKTYQLTGTLQNKATNKTFKVNEKEVTATKEFTPKEAKGTVNIEFTFDASSMKKEMDLVVFEKVQINKKDVAIHEDINSTPQTVHVKIPKAPVAPKPTPTTPRSNHPNVKTGDTHTQTPIYLIGIGLIGCCAWFGYRRLTK